MVLRYLGKIDNKVFIFRDKNQCAHGPASRGPATPQGPKVAYGLPPPEGANAPPPTDAMGSQTLLVSFNKRRL